MKQQKILKQIIINLILFLLSLCFLFPLLLVITTSFSGEDSLTKYGYTFFPREINLDAYKYIFRNPTQLLNSYKTTIITSLASVFLGTLNMCLAAYPLSRKNFPLKKPVTFYIFFTMLFGGGLIPSYIINTQYLHLGNTIWIYILPSLCSA